MELQLLVFTVPSVSENVLVITLPHVLPYSRPKLIFVPVPPDSKPTLIVTELDTLSASERESVRLLVTDWETCMVPPEPASFQKPLAAVYSGNGPWR
mmetsp:Transcript_102918/g.185729  ORF Transcript_102918/g.185729 Transcript_102918/m.185729 type:complete len:97 (+) Transcript_102918:644-934(+)